MTRSADIALQAVPDPTAVLDVGCGTGALLRTLADRLPTRVDLAGVDPARAMIEVGREALRERSNAHLEVAFAEQLPLRRLSAQCQGGLGLVGGLAHAGALRAALPHDSPTDSVGAGKRSGC